MPSLVYTAELKTRYATVVYKDEKQIIALNDNIILGELSYLSEGPSYLSYKEALKNKIDLIVERVESILEMYPSMMHFKIVILNDKDEVKTVFRRLYKRDANFIAFYSPDKKTVYLSLDDIELIVLAHEITHVVIDHYFTIAPPVKIHEILAQFVEKYLED
jgi:hypothetical protein